MTKKKFFLINDFKNDKYDKLSGLGYGITTPVFEMHIIFYC